MKAKRTKEKIAVWGTIKNGKPNYSDYNKQRIRWFSEKREGKSIKTEFSVTAEAKTDKLLGFYWAGLLPAKIANDKFNITEQRLHLDSLLLKRLCEEKQITKAEIDDWHKSLTLEFCPNIMFDIRGNPVKERGRMSKMNQIEAMEYILVVEDYYIENGIPIPNNKEYLEAKDTLNTLRTKKNETN